MKVFHHDQAATSRAPYRSVGRLLKGVAICGLASLAIVSCNDTDAPTPPDPGADPLLVSTTEGQVRGVNQAGIRQFLGIPYAAPPVGDLRWRPPQEPASWSEPLDASEFGNTCAQGDALAPFAAPSEDEDCLYLNVFTPTETDPSAEEKKRPVMVWIHGGGLRGGASNDYDASKLVKDGDTVVVSFNYRLGVFGFMAHPSLYTDGQTTANYGLLDQQFALEWVQDNIEAFGGDPENVTIFGESSGGFSVLAHMASPGSAGTFHRAIIQSGASVIVSPQPTLEDAEIMGSEFAEAIGCPEQTASCLRSVSVEDILEQGSPFFPGSGAVVDGVVLPQQIREAISFGEFNRVPVINGSNRDEYTWFLALDEIRGGEPMTVEEYPARLAERFGEGNAELVLAEYPLSEFGSPSEALAAAVGDQRFICSARTLDELLSPFTSTFAYEFADRTAPQSFPPVSYPYKAAHTSEIQYLFPLFHGASGTPRPLNPGQQKLSDQMVSYWTTFAETGDPNASDVPTWPRYTPEAGAFMSLRTPEPVVISEADFVADHHCEFWDEFAAGS